MHTETVAQQINQNNSKEAPFMTNKWKKTAAFALSLAIVAVNSASAWSNTNAIVAKAAETNDVAITADSEEGETPVLVASEKEEKDETYYDEETATLHLKGYIRNAEDGSGLVLPEGIDRWYIESIVADEGTVFPENCRNLFGNLSYVWSIDLKNADTSNVTDMSMMFWGLGTEELDLSGFDTSKVTNMREMFSCSFISSLDLSSFDTSNVTDMAFMFSYANFNNTDLSGFDTSKVTDMSGMFICTNSSTLDLTSFDTSNVTEMYDMFAGSRRLETIYVSDKWSVENVDSEQYSDEGMFFDCICLSGGNGTVYDPDFVGAEYARIDGGAAAPGYLSAVGDKKDLSYFDKKTSTLHLKGYVKNSDTFEGIILPEGINKEDVLHIVADEGAILPAYSGELFIDMTNLETVDLKNAVTSIVVNMSSLFNRCENLVSIDFGDFNTSKVNDMSFMFFGCEKLTDIDLSSFDTSNVNYMYNMFDGCVSLASLDLSSFDTGNVWDMGSMFSGCSFESIDLSNFDTRNVSYMNNMFGGCADLESLDLSSFDTTYVCSMSYMFSGCSSLSYVDLSSFSTSNVFDISYMFGGCQSLEVLDLSKFDLSNVMMIDGMFYDCSELSTIYAGVKWTTRNVDTSWGVYDVFEGCYNLVGGAGTTYDPYNTGISYARIDGGRLLPGYLTADPDIVKNTVKEGVKDIKSIADTVKDLLDRYNPFKRY